MVKGFYCYAAAGFGGGGGCGMLRGGAQLVANVAIVTASNNMPVNLFFIVVCLLIQYQQAENCF